MATFDPNAYTEGGWRSALSEDHYEQLGLMPSDANNSTAITAAFNPRFEWWLTRESQYKSGHQVRISQEVGPQAARAKRNLEQAKKVLSSRDLRGQYDEARAKTRLTVWQSQSLRPALVALVATGQPTRDAIEALVRMGVGEGLAITEVRAVVDAELLRAGATPVRSKTPAIPDIGGLARSKGMELLNRIRLPALGGNRHHDVAAADFFTRKRDERRRAENEKRRRAELARSLKTFTRLENERIWSMIRPFEGSWVANNEWMRASRIRLTKADDGGVWINVKDFQIQFSCHQSHHQWWYDARYRKVSSPPGAWMDWNPEPTSFEQMQTAFMWMMDKFIDSSRVR